MRVRDARLSRGPSAPNAVPRMSAVSGAVVSSSASLAREAAWAGDAASVGATHRPVAVGEVFGVVFGEAFGEEGRVESAFAVQVVECVAPSPGDGMASGEPFS